MIAIQKIIGFAILFVLFNTHALANQQANQEIGRIYEGLPYEDQLDESRKTAPCRFVQQSGAPGLENHDILIAECDGRRAQAWLRKMNRRPTFEKSGEFEVVDFLSLGTLKKSEFVSPLICVTKTINSHPNWVGIYRDEKPNKNRKKYTHKNGGLVQAWVVNNTTQRFELASPKMLKEMVCEPEFDEDE